MWDVRRILKDLAGPERRREILISFWRHGDASSRAVVAVQLSRALHFREETLRKMPAEKKADLFASRIGAHEFDQYFEAALMQYLTHEHSEMLGAFLDLWNIPHVKGSIEAEDFKVPVEGQVRDAVRQLESRYEKTDIAVYLAAAGLLMGGAWRDATWPVVDDLAKNA
jgi:hypothetical protein